MNTGFDFNMLSLELDSIDDFDMSDFGFEIDFEKENQRISENKEIDTNEFNKVVLNFNEKPITYGEFKDTKFKLLHKGTDEYKYWHLKKSSDTSLRDAILRETGKNKRFNEKYIKDNMVCGTIVSKGKILRFDFPAKISNKEYNYNSDVPSRLQFLRSKHTICLRDECSADNNEKTCRTNLSANI